MQQATGQVSPNEAPVGADSAMNKQLARDWKEMEERVQKLAELSRGQVYDKELEPHQVIANLNIIQAKTKKKANSTWGKFQHYLDNTLTAVSSVGAMIADAASQVFAPAGQCYNAINFVISAWQGYMDAFEVLNGLLEDCLDFLNRLSQYVEGKMHAALSKVASDTLRTFVDICDRAIRLRSSRGSKVIMFMKVAFLSQNDFTDLRSHMDKLTQRENLHAIAGTYKNSAIAAEGVTKALDLLNEDHIGKQEQEQDRLDTQALNRVLAFDKTPETWDSTVQEPIQGWARINRKIHNKRVDGTGDWLLRDDLFTAWARGDGDNRLLALVGEPGSGKSFLVSAAISHLRTASSSLIPSKEGNVNSRRLVAFHYIDKDTPNVGIHNLGKSIIWQFAEADASYKQSAANICKKHIEPKDILPRLLLDNHKDVKHIDAVFYIVINKLGNHNYNVAETLLKFLQGVLSPEKSAVRVLFSTTQGTMEKLKARGISCPTIQISEKNEPDRRKYIASRMDGMKVLSNSRQLRKVDEIRQLIQDRLCEKIKDNYILINTTLDQIRPLESEEDILDILKDAGRSMSQHIRNDIAKLNDSRKPKELAEINEIILWLTFAKERMSPELMTAVLQVKNKAASLRPLDDRLKDKLILFEINDDGFVDFRAGNMSSEIPKRRDITKIQQNNSQVVTKGEVDIVSHFLKTVCPSDVLDKLQLHDYFDQKVRRREEQICQEDGPTANFLIAQTCVHVLANGGDSRLSSLRKYAVVYLPHHMFNTKRKSIDPNLLAAFGSDLAKLFRDPNATDNLLWASTLTPKVPELLRDNKFVEEVFNWLNDATVASNVEESKRWWTTTDNDLKEPRVLIEPLIHRLAVHCFQQQSRASVSIAAFEAIRDFCDQMKECPDAVAESRPPSYSEVEKWCQVVLRVKPNAVWHTQMAMILRGEGRFSEAMERCQKAIEADGKDWRPSLVLAKLVDSPKEAIDALEKLSKRFEKDKELREEHVESFADIAYNLGHRYWALNKMDKAIRSYTESISRDPSASEHTFLIISKYNEKEKWNEMLNLLDIISEHDMAHITALAVAMSETPEFHKIILRAMENTGNLTRPGLESFYEDAIATTKDRDHEASFYLQHYYASALSALHPAPIEKVRDILEGAVRDLPYTNLNLPRNFFLVGYRLGAIYLGEAKAAKTPEAAKKALQKLEGIVPEQLNEDQMRLPLSLFAARYHHTNHDDELARAEAHNTLRMAVELMSDGDPSNDMLAYRKILYGVIPFKDERNATAALAMMAREGEFEMRCSCGDCGHTWERPGNMWWCMDCINVVLTPECRDRVTSPTLPNSVCHEKHLHFYIPEWDEQKMNVPKNLVPYKGIAITGEQWRDKITDKYYLAKPGGLRRALHF